MKKILPPTLGLICLLSMLILDRFFPIVSTASAVLLILGLVFIGLGLVIAFAAEGQFRKARTTVNPFGPSTKLVTEGWFKYSRNPMYLGLTLLLIGAWIELGSLSPLLGVLVYLFVINRWYIPQEEKRLAATFGKEYEAYRMRTRRWL